MKIAAEWINEYLAKPLSPRAMADALELAGVEVEEITLAEPLDAKIIVGLVMEVKQHPNADRLKLTKVDVKNATFSIVCGAPNVAEGQHVAVAQVGAVLPGGMKIKASKIRGEESQGMLCSEQELGLSQNHEGILVLPENSELGQSVQKLLPSVDVIDATTAANRWDLTGIIGLAQEVAAHSNDTFKLHPPEQLSGAKAGGGSNIAEVQEGKLVGRYMLAGLEVDATRPTPDWMARRLTAAGVRPINVVVDITNYVMLEWGQPLHAFDAEKIDGTIVVRQASRNEILTTLDGAERKLSAEDLVITDSKQPIGLAGVMGGASSEIDHRTKRIFVESASFNAATVRKMAVRHGLRTDASARFERGVPVATPPLALARALELLQKHAAAKVTGQPADIRNQEDTKTTISVDPSRITKFLGIPVDAELISRQLAKLNFTVKADAAGMVTVGVPWPRQDVTAEADVAEEVMKLIGYDQLPATLPAWRPQAVSFDSHWSAVWRTKEVLRSLGLFELTSYSFIAREQIESLGLPVSSFLKLQNPMSSEQEYLRSTLLPSLLQVAVRNRNYAKSFGMFELSKLYLPRAAGELPMEPTYLGVLMRVETGGYAAVKAVLDRLVRQFHVAPTFKPGFKIKQITHPTRAAKILLGGEELGFIAQLHPSLLQAHKLSGEVGYMELGWDALKRAASVPAVRDVSRFPSVLRDLSIIIDRTTSWQEVNRALEGFNAEYLGDYYAGDLPKDKKSLTLRLTVTAPDRTLTDKEADARAQAAFELLKQRFGAKLRA
jgi:phenylalanyl-tRNA synthetase beta chain